MSPKSNSTGKRIDKVEDGEGKEKKCCRKHHHGRYKDERTHVNITVKVECCRCSPCGWTGNGGRSAEGRPTYQTGISDGSASSRGIGTPGGIIKIPSLPGNVWLGPQTQLYLPFSSCVRPPAILRRAQSSARFVKVLTSWFFRTSRPLMRRHFPQT